MRHSPKLFFSLLPAACLLLAACNKSPFDRTKDPTPAGGATGTFSRGSLIVFHNELQTGGGAFEFPGGENQVLSFSDTSNPISARSIKYVWNGGDVSSTFGPEHTFAGFDLMHTPTLATYSSTPGRDLRAAGYGKVTFWARGSLANTSNTLIKIQVSDDGNNATPAPCVSLSTDGTLDDNVNPGGSPCLAKDTISGNWKQYTITINNANLSNVKDFFKATFIFNLPCPVVCTAPGQGGTVFFDDIVYTQ